jgi:hypothetical protein
LSSLEPVRGDASDAPSTMLRMVPLPRFTVEDHGGIAAQEQLGLHRR